MVWSSVGFGLGMAMVYALAFLFFLPKKFWLRLAMNGALGLALLWVAEQYGSFWDAYLPMNLPTGLAAGLFGIPGVITMLAIRGIVL